MGILDQMLGGGAPAGSDRARRNRKVNSTLAAGVLAALAVKAMRDRQRPAEGRSFEPGGAPAGGGDILGGLGGLLGGGGGLGGLLGGMGAAGAIGGLVKAMQQRGMGHEAQSWVAAGPNQPIQPQQLAEALDDDTIQELQDHTGLPRAQLLAQLADELPEAVDQATPDGRLPSDGELQRATGA